MHPEIILGLLGSLLGLVLLVAFLALPIIAYVRTRNLKELNERIHRLEREVGRLRRVRRAEELAEVIPVEEPVAEVQVVQATPVAEKIPALVPARRRLQPGLTAASFEAWIGGRGLGWIAVVLLLFAGGFFLQQVFERDLIGELGRVAIGLTIGVALCWLGLRFRLRGWPIFSQMLTAGGIVLLYLATFATFGYYHLLAQNHAVIFLLIIIAEAAALAIVYEAPAIAIMAVIGGLLTPVLLHSERDQYRNLFTYLAVLDAGVVVLALFRPWPALVTVALAGTQALFWGWYGENYHPLKLTAALIFQAVLFLLFLGHSILGHVWQQRRANIEDLARVILSALFAAGAGFVLLDPKYHLWMGTFAVGMAIVYTLLTWVVLNRGGMPLGGIPLGGMLSPAAVSPGNVSPSPMAAGESMAPGTLARPVDQPLLLVMLATAMAFLAMVFPLQAEAGWIAVGWAVQGLALWWFGLRVRAEVLRGFGAIFFLLAAGRLLAVDTPRAHLEPFIPLLNKYGLPALAVTVCLIGAALVSRRFLSALKDLDLLAMRIVGLAGVGLLWVVISIETYDYFNVQAQRVPQPGTSAAYDRDETGHIAQMKYQARVEHLNRTVRTSLSVVWALFALAMLMVGFRLPSRPLRWAALGLFGITLGKVVLVDMERLPGYYKVAVFLALSLMMMAAAWGYQKVKHTLLAGEPGGSGGDNF